MKKFLKALTFLFIALSFHSSKASHIEAGDLTFACVGPHQYLITLNLYRDCNGIPLPDTAQINYSSTTCGVTGSLNLLQNGPILNVTDTCPGHNSACNGGSGFGVEKHTYVAVLNLPSGCGADWILSYRNCARNAAITTITNPGNTCFYIKATLNNTLAQCDHSPTFLKDPVAFTCLDQLDQLNQGGYDADGDSIVYSLVASESAANTSVNYRPGYSATNPLSVTGTFGFNTATGQISYTPNITQVGVMKILVSEFRDGILIGTVERDMQVVVQACSDSVPQLSNVITSSLPHTNNSVLIQACSSGCFGFLATTTNPDTSIHLTVSWTGQNNVPGATLTSTSGHSDSVVFCWSPTRANAGTHNFFVTVRDNACPNPGQNTTTYTVTVPQVDPAGPDQTICQYNTANAQATGTGTWTIMPFNPATTIVVTPTSPTTLITGFTSPGRYNYIWTNGTCVDTMSIIVNAKPNAGIDKTICQFNTVAMTASGSGRWSAINTNPAVTTFGDSTLNSTTISGFTVIGTYRYVWKSNGCTDTVNVVVTAKPNAGPDQNLCGALTLTTMAATGTGTWTAAATNPAITVIVSPTSPTTIVTGLTLPGAYVYYWTNACSDTVVINVATAPNGGADQTICQNSTISMAGVGIGLWSALASNPAITTITNSSLANTTISGFTVAGVYRYLWSLGGTCIDTVNITVNARSNAGTDKNICVTSLPITMAASGPGPWVAAVGNPATTTITNPASGSTTISGFTALGNYTFYWGTACPDTILVHVNPQPSGGPDQTICQYNTVNMAAASSGGSWLALASNPAPVTIANDTDPSSLISGFTVAGTYTFIWSVTSTCFDTVKIFVTAKPNAGADQTICQYTSTTMAATGRGRWTAAASNPRLLAFANDTLATSSIGRFDTAGIYTYYWSQNGCSDTIKITVTAKPNAGPDQTICQNNSTTLSATGSGTWTTAAANPHALTFVSATSPGTVASGFTVAGTYTLYWTQNGCSDTVLVNVTAKPFAGNDQNICSYNHSTTMTAIGRGIWTASAGNPHATTFTNDTLATTTVNGFDTTGIYTFYWSRNGCSDTMLVTVRPKPNAGPDVHNCYYSGTFTINMAATGVGTWSIPSGFGGSLINIATPGSPTTAVTTNLMGSTPLIWSNQGCSDTALIIATPTSVHPDQSICLNGSATLIGATWGRGIWTAGPSNPGPVTLTSFHGDTAVVTGFSAIGTYTFVYRGDSIYLGNYCVDTSHVFVLPNINAGPAQSVCAPGSITTAASGTGHWRYATGNPGTTTITDTNSAVTSITGFVTGGLYKYIWTNGVCTDTLRVTAVPLNSAGPDQTICQFNTIKTASFGPGTWSAGTTNPATTSIVNPISDSTLITGFTVAGNYTFIWQSGICTDTMIVHVNAGPNGGPDQNICQYTTTVMAAIGTGTWGALTTLSLLTIANASSPTTLVSGFIDSGTYTLFWSNSGCTDTVYIHVTAKPNAGADQTICQYTSAKMNAAGSGIWTALSTNPIATSILNPISDTTIITGFSLPGIYNYVWTSNGCTDTTTVIVTAKPNAGADQTICQYTSALMSAAGSGLWSSLPTNPHAVTFTNINFASSSISGFTVAGTYGFVWTSNGCTDTVSIFVTAKPNAGVDQTICQYNLAILSATGAGQWTAASNPSVLTFINDTLPNTSVSGFIDSGTYTLYWSKSGCTDTVLIHVTAKPNAGPDQTICQYTTAKMGATGTGVWTALGANPHATAFTTASFDSTIVSGFTIAGTYGYVWTSNGCTDTMNIFVTAKPNAGPDQTICQYTTTSMMAGGVGTWTALSSNPHITTFTNTNYDSTLVSGFTVAGAYSFVWTSNGCIDTTTVNVTAKPDAGADQTTCQYTSVRMHASFTGLWTALSGNPATATIVTPAIDSTVINGFTQPGTYSFIWTSNNCTDTVNVFVTAKPNAGADRSICQFTSTTLNATGSGIWTAAVNNPASLSFVDSSLATTSVSGFDSAGIYTLYWSLNGCTDTVKITVIPIPNGGFNQTTCQYSTITTSAIGTGRWTADPSNPAIVVFANDTLAVTYASGFTVPGTYTLHWSVNSCVGNIYVTVIPKPDAGADQSLCLPGTVTTAAHGGAGTWSALAGNPTATSFTNAADSNTTISGFSAGGIYQYLWTVNGCSDTMSINITPLAPAGTDQTICQYFTATTAAYGTGSWTALATNPTTTNFANANADTTLISGFTVAGSNGFVWTTINSCTDTMYITVTSKPDAGVDQTICQYSGTLMTASGIGLWTSGANPATVNFGNTASANSSVTGFIASGIYTFYWTVGGCTDTVLINVSAKPNAGPDQTICQYTTASMSATGIGTWSAELSNPATTTITNTTLANTVITGFNSSGIYSFYWTNNGCSDTVLINVTAKPNAGPDQSLCLPGTITTAASGSGTWTALSSNPSTTAFVSNTDPATTISGFTAGGIYSYVWTVNGCTDTMSVTITPTSPAGPDQNICQFNTITTASYGSGTWSAFNTNPATTTFSNATSDTSVISGFTLAGTYGFVWSTVNSCTDTMYVIVTAKPDAGSDQTICQYTTTSMTATGTGIWTRGINPASVAFADSTLPTTSISGFTTSGIYTFYWSNNGCSDTILINVTAKPDAGADQNICQNSGTSMTATGSGSWTQDAANPVTVTFANSTSATSAISGFTLGGTYIFYWSNNGCTDTTVISVTTKPNAGTDQTICQYNSTSMTATGSGTWTQAANPSVVSFSNTTSATSGVSGFTIPGAYNLYWTLNGCTDTVVVNVTAKPNAGADQTICQYSATSMAATGSGAWTQDASNPVTVSFADTSLPTSTISGFSISGSYIFYWSNNGCTDTVLISVTAKPDAGTDQIICQYSTTALNAVGTGSWTSGTNPASVTFGSTSSPTSSVSGFTAPGIYTFYWNVNGCADTVLINVTAKPIAGIDQTICQYNTTAMAATGLGAWTQANGNPLTVSFSDTSSPTAIVSGFTRGGSYTFYWSYNGCSDTVLINVTAKPDAGTDQSICQNSTTGMTATGSGVWTSYSLNPAVVTFTNTASATSNVSGFTQAGTYLFFWTNNGCSDTVVIGVATSNTLTVSGRGGICPGFNDTLTANVTVANGQYLWSPGGQTTASIIVSPATTATYSVTYTIAICGASTDTATVTVYPPMTLSHVNDTICTGSSVNLAATPSTLGGVYAWAPGGQSTASITVSPTSQSIYDVTYSLKGCPTVTAHDTVTVTIPPTLSIRDTTVCQGNAASLTAIPSQAGGTYSWAPGGQLTQSITVTPLNSTQYTVTYGIPGSVCPPTIDTATIFVTPQPSLSVSNDSICFGKNAVLTATPNVSGGTYVWTPTGSTSNSITVSPPSTTTYTVVYTVANCGVANGSGTVTVFQNPTLSLDSQNISCYGYNNGIITPVINPASGTYTYNWSNGTHGAVDSNLTATGGPYSLTITDAHSCTASAGPVNIVEPPLAFAEVMPADTTVLQGSDVPLASSFTGYPASTITSYNWSPSDGLSCTNCPDPTVNTTNLTDSIAVYTMTVYYNKGCHVSASDTIHVQTGLAIGSAFTPNGDGQNDYFTFIALGVKDFHMMIYNRWGQTVYESSDPKAGWDGNYNGIAQPSEIYTYFISITNLNGSSLHKSGQVTLFR